MNIPLKPIRTKADHDAALELLEMLWDAKPGSPEADQLEILGILIDQYETARFQISSPDPVRMWPPRQQLLKLSKVQK